MVDIDRRFQQFADVIAGILIRAMERRERVESTLDATHDRTGAQAAHYGLTTDRRPMIDRSAGPLHVASTSLYASDQAYGLVYALILRTASRREKFRAIRGFYFPLRKRLIWVYLDYR